MLFAHHVDDNEEYVLVLPAGSVRSYFRREGRGMALVVEPGLLSVANEFARVEDAARTAVLAEAGLAMDVLPADVLSQPFERLKAIAERDAIKRTPWDSRRRTRGVSARLCR